MNAGRTSASKHGEQLVLAFPLNSRCRLDEFVPGENAEALTAIRALAVASGRFRACLLAGPPGTGRTHLLQAVCRETPGAIYLPLAEAALDAEVLEGLEHCPLVALDDLEAWLGSVERERALLALYQGLVAAGGTLVMAADRPPALLETHFPDLRSRLRSLSTYVLRPLDERGLRKVLGRLAAERGLELPGAVLDYWLGRAPRDLAGLIRQFDVLDAAALAAQRRITIPLLKAVLAL